MKYASFLAAAAALGVKAQLPTGLPPLTFANCSDNQPPPPEDPLVMFPPASVQWPCSFGGAPIPFGKVPEGCAKFEVIVARGTSEPGQFGAVVGDPVVARVKRDMPGEDVRGYPVQYPAALTGADQGVADVLKRLQQQDKDCPDEKFALVGYSQGGGVVSAAAPSIPASIQEKIVAIVLYGSPARGNYTVSEKGKILANCAPGDTGCGNTTPGPGHLSYNDEGTKWHDRSSEFIVNGFHGTPLPGRTEFSPTRRR